MDRNVDEAIRSSRWSTAPRRLRTPSTVGGGCEWDGELTHTARERARGGATVCEWGVETAAGGVLESVMSRAMSERWRSYATNGGAVKKWDSCAARKEGGWAHDFTPTHPHHHDDDAGCCLRSSSSQPPRPRPRPLRRHRPHRIAALARCFPSASIARPHLVRAHRCRCPTCQTPATPPPPPAD